MGKDRSKDGDAATSSTDNKDHSWDQESRDAALARTIAEAVALQTKSIVEMFSKQKIEETKSIVDTFSKQRSEETQSMTEAFSRQMEKTHVQYEELLKASRAQNFPSTFKVTSSSEGFRVTDPFDWTMDKNIYQRWQLWSHKGRLALEAMEGDTEKTKISYLHHWFNGDGISKIKGWKNSKTLISQEDYDKLADKTGKYSLDKVESYFTLCENILTPRSNPLLSVEDLHHAKQGSMTSEEFHSHILQIVKRCQTKRQRKEPSGMQFSLA